jgi:tetratricopeptide (TPR) repeat protein
MECVSEAQVLGLLRNTLDAEQRTAVERHLDVCPECLELVTLASQTSLVTQDPATPAEPTADATVLVAGTTVGRYQIVEPLGRGGMGMVYVARDAQLDRRVAIKLVHARFAHHDHAQVGLLREAQAMARITQPNVLTVYDTGMFDDAVFLAAELVDGETLDAWLARPRRWREIVDKLVQAARGLDAAHAAGLVHRDFKPANVLVGRDDRVRVFDFGVARFVDAPASRELAGTPLYMSPEQQRGSADARSDQYSFGIALYEALYGAHPDRSDASARLRPVDRVPRWLREVVDRTLAADPAARFPSMRAVIAAIEHGLGRRRRALAAGAVGLVVVAVAVTAVLGYARGRREQLARCEDGSVARVWDAATRTQVATAVLGTGVAYAASTLPRIQQGLDQFVRRWQGEQRDTCLAFEVRDGEDRALHDRRRACLDRQRLVFEAIVARFTAADRDAINQVNQLLGALPHAEDCARPDGTAWPTNPSDRVRLTRHFQDAARIASLADAGQLAAAERQLPALVDNAAALGSRSAEADAAYLAGRIAGLRGDYGAAVAKIEQALWAAEATRHDDLVVAAATELLSLVGYRQRRPADARPYAPLARASAERVGSVTARAAAARAIGSLELESGHYDLAEREFAQAMKLAESRAPVDRIEIAGLLRDQANLESRRGRFTAAEPKLRRALQLIGDAVGELHPAYAQTLNNLGNLLADLHRLPEARQALERAAAILETAGSPDLVKTLSNLAGVCTESGDFERGQVLLERVAAQREAADPSSPGLASTLNNLSEAYRLAGRPADAERVSARALAIRRQRLGDHHPDTTQSLLSLHALAYDRHDLDAADHWCAEARASVTGSDADNRALRATVETCRGRIELARGRRASAQAILEDALAMHGADAEPLRLAATQFELARALPASQATRALDLARKARAGFAVEPAYLAGELAEVDAWLRAHER